MRRFVTYAVLLSVGMGCDQPIISVDLQVPAACEVASGYYFELTTPGSDGQDCIINLCQPPAPASECLDGVQSAPIEPGVGFQLRLGLYDDQRALIACGIEGRIDGADEGDTVELRLMCTTSSLTCPNMLEPQMLQTQECAP